MNTLSWIVFALLGAIQLFAVCQFARKKQKALIKTVLSAYLPFAAFFLVVMLFSLRIPQAVLVFAMCAQLSHCFLGYYLRLYERSKVFDRYNHAGSTFAYALLAYCTLAALFGEASPKMLAALLVTTLGVTLGVFVEILEFICDAKGKVGIKMQKGLKDTNFDLVFDAAGAAAAGVFAYFFLLP